jgi:hypothetical protein
MDMLPTVNRSEPPYVMNGIQEVVGSIPSGSTRFYKGLARDRWALFLI